MRRRFFVEHFADGTAELHGDAAHHLVRVLRAEPGQVYELSDGRNVFLGRLERVGRDAAHFLLLDRVPEAPPTLEIALLIAIVKLDRFEWALEKATQLGVASIVPLAAERSEKALAAAAPKRAVRWRKILGESAQQARCLRPPALEELTKPAAAFRAASGNLRLLLSERSGAVPLRDVLSSARVAASRTPYLSGAPTSFPYDATERNPSQISLAIGPEGGWTDAEFAAAHDAGFREVALGCNILRTETAVIAGLAAVQLYLGSIRAAGISQTAGT